MCENTTMKDAHTCQDGKVNTIYSLEITVGQMHLGYIKTTAVSGNSCSSACSQFPQSTPKSGPWELEQAKDWLGFQAKVNACIQAEWQNSTKLAGPSA